MKQQIFIYGTLLDQELRKEILGKEVGIIEDVVEDFEISKIKDSDSLYYPDLKEKRGSILRGAVIEVNDTDIKKLDLYEGELYKRKLITTKSGMRAWVYYA